MTLTRLFLISCLFFSLFTHAVAQSDEPYPFKTEVDAVRFNHLIKEIRCVVCQNQNLADSNAPLANDLRQKIYGFVLNQQSDAEIKDYLVKRYGDFILLQPRFNKVTFLLWSFPLLGLLCLAFLLFRIIKAAPLAPN